MTASATSDWSSANQAYLLAALAALRLVLEGRIARSEGDAELEAQLDVARSEMESIARSMSSPPALETLSRIFSLSSFERDLLLLCAAVEMDSRFASLCAAAQGDSSRPFPTFSLALAALADAHWSALSPARPLRSWRLIEIAVAGSNPLTVSPIRIDERVLHYITGVQHLDERLVGLIEPLPQAGGLLPSHNALAEQIASAWSQATEKWDLPVAQLCGDESVGKRAIASAACSALGLNLYVISSQVIPSNPSEMESLIRLWKREAALTASALLIECSDLDTGDVARERIITNMIERAGVALMVASRERLRIRPRSVISFDVSKPTAGEQRAIWHNIFCEIAPGLNGQLDSLVSQFNLGVPTIHAASAEALGRVAAGGAEDLSSSDEFSRILWDSCRAQACARLDDLAQRIEPVATWDDIVLPEAQRKVLGEIAMHVRQRSKVYEAWGFVKKGERGLGISVLFAGASGTGKTMAAEVLANELRLDLYRIDLSSVVSKYIGETEKNLRRVFDAAEEGGAVLLFDEADALFGKRSEVKDSHDRYANIEVSYLLQRMEAYRGLAILTTNLKNALDTAFLRRLRFILEFPFPDARQRAEIWERVFPIDTPTEGLDSAKLARLSVAGGNIRNIALHAAFLAADADEPVRMIHLLRAASGEYSKLEKQLTGTEIGDWVEEGI